ncbi:MAG: peptide chain release factor N(5)-glutamine methyltransferase [Saprospiraceae bacterium]|nr:peptide chain release factor N(5)-glutamine methyltransferase [Saprospiraceae bacterium]
MKTKAELVEVLLPLYGEREAAVMARYLFLDLFDGRSDLNASEQVILENAADRLLRHEPLQYITGKAYFRDLVLYVAPGVLIPRPETEELVDLVLTYVQKHQISHILDVGTGSGCIALALKKELPEVEITAIDKSEAALEIARRNARTLDLNIELMPCDFLSSESRLTLPAVDLIVSNPPYIGTDEAQTLSPNVLEYEPAMALFAEGDPLVFYKAIAAYAALHHTPVFCEINERLAQEARNCFLKADYDQVVVHKDLQGKDRMLVAL